MDRAWLVALAPWRKQWAVFDSGKILLDLAISVAKGGDALADVGLLRAEPSVFGRVASDPTCPGWSTLWLPPGSNTGSFSGQLNNGSVAIVIR